MLAASRDEAPQLGAEARFFSYRDVDSESAEILAGAGAFRPDVLAPGQCVRLEPEALLDEALAFAPPDASVRMLDAGEIVVSLAGRTLRLAPRYKPEIVPVVAGVFYQMDGAAAFLPEPREGEEAQVSAWGGPDVGRFDVQATVPRLARLTTVNGRPPEEAVIDRFGELEVHFAPPQTTEEVAVTLSWSGGELRCRPLERDRLVMPRSAILSALRGVETELLQLAIERSLRTTFHASGLESAEIEVVVCDKVRIRLM